MGRDGTERTSAKTATMDVHGELDHLVSRNALTLVFGMGIACIGQVERCIELFGSHGRVGRIDDHIASVNALQQTLSVHHVTLLLYVLKVLGLSLLIFQALLMRMEYDVVIGNAIDDILLA